MVITRVVLVAVSLALALPAFGMTYKSKYSNSCQEIWPAVKVTLSNADNYQVVSSDDTKMTASYNVKHAAHVNVSGAILQRTNKVTLVPKDSGCEMQVVSNYSGWEHDDKGDFKKRVDEQLAKQPAKPQSQSASSQEAKPEAPGK